MGNTLFLYFYVDLDKNIIFCIYFIDLQHFLFQYDWLI